MTRINCVPVNELSRRHLIAEYRELPRIFGLAHAAYLRGERHDDPCNPLEYTLGTGHCRFFYPRLLWLQGRQQRLIDEMRARSYNPAWTLVHSLDFWPEDWCQDWTPTPEALALNRARIAERS